MAWIRDRALTLSSMAMFLVFLAGQRFTGLAEYNNEQVEQAQQAARPTTTGAVIAGPAEATLPEAD